jgi:hypothetical protein
MLGFERLDFFVQAVFKFRSALFKKCVKFNQNDRLCEPLYGIHKTFRTNFLTFFGHSVERRLSDYIEEDKSQEMLAK